MATFGEAMADLKRRVNVTGSARDTEIGDILREAIVDARGQPYWFLRKTGDKTLVSGASTVNVYTDMDMPIAVDLVDSNRRYTHKNGGFRIYPYERFKDMFLTSATLSTGRPTACAILGTKLYVNRLADQNYTISFMYAAKDSTLPTADGDTSVWLTSDGYNYVITLAAYLYETLIKKNQNASDAGVKIALKALNEKSRFYEIGSY